VHSGGSALFHKAGVAQDLDDGVLIAEACLLYGSNALSGAYERARLPFLLTVTPVRPYPALTAGTRLLISAAKEGKDASPFNDFGKSPEEKPPPRR
jgi:hypothetical protein